MKAAIIKTARVGQSIYSLDTKGTVWGAHYDFRAGPEKFNFSAADFDLFVAKMKKHNDQKRGLCRRPSTSIRNSMWGAVQGATRYGDGIQSVSTAGHGGFILSEERNAAVHSAWRARNGQYEEDGHWSVVAFTFPQLFTDWEIELAYATLRNWYPDEFTAVTGEALTEEDSRTLRERAATERNKGKWVVVSPINDNGMVRWIAKLGGDRSSRNERVYLVPKDEYHIPVGGFVIDEARHKLAA